MGRREVRKRLGSKEERLHLIVMMDNFNHFTVDHWKLTLEECIKLLNLSSIDESLGLRRTIEKIPNDEIYDKVFLRLIYVSEIYFCLQIIFSVHRFPENKATADAWVRRPNSYHLFGGRSALEKMTSGKLGDLKMVRDYLKSQIV
ncbi:MAG: MbcA/ParS/Xre antitoxin family protein [bacterium]|nr:MbcA/ParS/Xre antitoxin family protein [bacterium]